MVIVFLFLTKVKIFILSRRNLNTDNRLTAALALELTGPCSQGPWRMETTYNELLFLFPGFLNYDLDLLVQSFHAVPEPRACRLGDGDDGDKCALWSRSLKQR